MKGELMKRLLLLTLAFLMVTSFSFGATKTLKFGWQQDLPSPNDMAGWKLYQATVTGGPWILIETISYTAPATEYFASKSIIVPDGQVTTLFFTVTAFDTSGNESGRSNEVAASLDFQSPGIPVQFKITITTP